MVDYESQRELITTLFQAGKSSRQIASILSKSVFKNEKVYARSVRYAIDRWDLRDDRTEPAKILVFDIETAPMVTYAWQAKTRYINSKMVLKDWFVLCWSAKWLFNEEIFSDCVTPEEALHDNDERISKSLWKLMDEADILIAHNGDKFDVKKMNARFAKHKLFLPSPYKTIDTYKASRKRLNLSYYSLHYVAEYFEVPHKKYDTNIEMWHECREGNGEVLNDMQEYCDQDIRVLEDVYLYLRPYIQPHPNLGLYIEEHAKMCPSCASTELEKCGHYATTVNLYEAYRCQRCGSLTRARKTSLTKEDKETITSSLPR